MFNLFILIYLNIFYKSLSLRFLHYRIYLR